MLSVNIAYALSAVWIAGTLVAWYFARQRNLVAEDELRDVFRRDISDKAKRELESEINHRRQRLAGYLFALSLLGAVIGSIKSDNIVMTNRLVRWAVWLGAGGYAGAAYYLMHWFVLEVWAELKRVVWPSKDETYSLTAVVIWAILIVAAYMGLLDFLCTYVTGAAHLYD